MVQVSYGSVEDTSPHELAEFYDRMRYDLDAETQQMNTMMKNSALAFVTARAGGKLIGVARGFSDGVRGWFTECKLDPDFQGPGAVTRRDGRIEDDQHRIAAEMAKRVMQALFATGVRRVDALAWGTELDFCEELGFRKLSGTVGLTIKAEEYAVK